MNLLSQEPMPFWLADKYQYVTGVSIAFKNNKNRFTISVCILKGGETFVNVLPCTLKILP